MRKHLVRAGIFTLLLLFAVSSLPARGPNKEGEKAAKDKKGEMAPKMNKQDTALGRFILKQVDDGKSGEELGKAIREKAKAAGDEGKKDKEVKREGKEGSMKKGDRPKMADKEEGSMKKGDPPKKEDKESMEGSAKKEMSKEKRAAKAKAVSDLGKMANEMIKKGASDEEIAAAVEKEAAKMKSDKEKKEKSDEEK